MNTTLIIKNMVCDRCITVVSENLGKLGYTVLDIELGKVEIAGELPKSAYAKINSTLSSNGFELMKGADVETIEKIKKLVLDHLYDRQQKPEKMNFSDYLAKKIGLNYFNLSKLFSTTEGMTIERYIILQKIERVKELLMYDQMSLGEIVFKLQYSSISHLSRQFKQVTGFTPTGFKKSGGKGRKSLDNL